MRTLNFYYKNGDLCLEMNETFIKYAKIAKDICNKIYVFKWNGIYDENEITREYEKLASYSTDYIKSKYKVDDKFIEWWNVVVTKKFYEILDEYYNDVNKCMTKFKITKDFDIDLTAFKEKSTCKANFENVFYKDFLLFKDICICGCYYCLSNYCISTDRHTYYICEHIKRCYLQNLYNNHIMYESARCNQEKFIENHRSDVKRLRSDIECCTRTFDKNVESVKIFTEETDMNMSDIEHRIDKLEYLLSGNIDYKIIDAAVLMPKKPIATCEMLSNLEDVIKEQAKMIQELKQELQNQHNEFLAYKAEKQRQLSALLC